MDFCKINIGIQRDTSKTAPGPYKWVHPDPTVKVVLYGDDAQILGYMIKNMILGNEMVSIFGYKPPREILAELVKEEKKNEELQRLVDAFKKKHAELVQKLEESAVKAVAAEAAAAEAAAAEVAAVKAVKCAADDFLKENAKLQKKNAELLQKLQESAVEAAVESVPPLHFQCPIMHEVMIHPVICCDGYSYERSAILRWFENHSTSPMTNVELNSTTVVPNYALRSAIEAWQKTVSNAAAAERTVHENAGRSAD